TRFRGSWSNIHTNPPYSVAVTSVPASYPLNRSGHESQHSAILHLCQDGAISNRKGSTMPTLTPEIIEAAIDGLEAKKQRIDVQIAELRALLSPSGNGSTPAPQPTVRKKRGMSAAGRKAIAEAQRKRWAAAKGHSVNTEATKKPKRKLSAAGRAAIVA